MMLSYDWSPPFTPAGGAAQAPAPSYSWVPPAPGPAPAPAPASNFGSLINTVGQQPAGPNFGDLIHHVAQEGQNGPSFLDLINAISKAGQAGGGLDAPVPGAPIHWTPGQMPFVPFMPQVSMNPIDIARFVAPSMPTMPPPAPPAAPGAQPGMPGDGWTPAWGFPATGGVPNVTTGVGGPAPFSPMPPAPGYGPLPGMMPVPLQSAPWTSVGQLPSSPSGSLVTMY